MEVSYLAVLVCGVVAMAVGFVWYGPLFSKKWLEAMNVSGDDLAKRQAMQKNAGPLYFIQFVLVLLQVYILSHFIQAWDNTGIETALWIWLGFVMPTLAGSAMWNTLSNRQRLILFSLTAGYQLIIFILFGFILSQWG